MGFECIQLCGPETSVAIQKFVELRETVTLERVQAALAVRSDGHQFGVGERLQMSRHRRLSQVRQGIDQISRRAGSREQQIHQRAASRVSDGGERVHVLHMNHDSYECQVI